MIVEFTVIEFVAWWGAIIATLVLAWDIYKWKTRGPNLHIRLTPNMKVIGDPVREGQTWVTINVSNVGDRPTTIKSFGFEFYPSLYSKIRGKSETAFFITNPSDAKPLPLVLSPGEEWIGMAPQDKEDLDLKTMARDGYLVGYLSVSHSRKPLKKRLIFSDK